MMRATFSRLFFLALLLPAYAGAVTPQQFGAKADGIHDDTKAIQEAINQRGRVIFPEGTYLISSKLIVYSGNYLLGQKNVTIKQTKDTFILFNEHSQVANAEWDENITIRNIMFDGSLVDAKSEYTAGLYMCGVRNLKVDNCTLKDIGGDGVYLGRGGKGRFCENVQINNCVFENCGRNVSNPRQSIAVVFADNVRIRNCIMETNRKSSAAVDVEPNNPDEHCSVSISNCRMIGCGISCGGNKSASKTIVVDNCYINCSGTENATLAIVKADARIIGNTIISNGKQNGINIVTSPYAIVKKNSIRDAAAGILITDRADTVTVRGNRIENCSSGVYIIKSRAVAVLSNILRVRGKGVYVRMESSMIRVEKNRIKSESGVDILSMESSDTRSRRNKKLK